MKNKKWNIFIITGLLLIAAALCLTIYNIWDEQRADKASENALKGVESHLSDKIINDIDSVLNIPEYVLNPDMEMPIISVDGNDYIGILSIPSIDIELPVMSDWSYKKLKIAPCRYAGSVYKNNIVIAAHNYNRHFGKIQELQIGSLVSFKDSNGNMFDYKVVEMEILQPTAVEEMKTGDWDLTLFTCTLGGRTRVTVRCEKYNKII